MNLSALDTSALLAMSQEELEVFIKDVSIADSRTLLDRVWERIRDQNLHGGQPRNNSSRSSLEFARLALKIAAYIPANDVLAEAQSMMAYASNANECFLESLPYYESAIQAFDDSGQDLKAARNRLGLMMALSMLGRSTEALDIGNRAGATFARYNDLGGQARLSVNLGIVCQRLNDYPRALEHYMTAAQVFEAVGNEQALAQCYLNLANVLSQLDRFDDAEITYKRSEELSRKLGLDELWRQAAYNKAHLFFLRGQLRQALTLFAEIREEFAENGSERHAALCDLDCAELYLQVNLPSEAGELARRAVDTFKSLGLGSEHAKAMAFYGVTLAQNRQVADALDVFETAQDFFSKLGNTYWIAVLELYRAELLLSIGRLWEARGLALSADQKFAESGLVHKRAASLVVRGELALKLEHLSEAVALADQIRSLSDTGHILIQQFPCSFFRAKVAERTGDHEQAQFLYLQASAEIETQRVSFLHNDLRLTLFNGKQEVYAALVTRSLGEDDDESAAFTWCERAKARQLIDMVEHHLPIIRPHTDHSLLTRINHLRHELNSRYFQLGTGTDELPLLGSSDAINAKQIELNSCLQQMADIDPQYVALQTDSVVDLSELQSNLSSDTTLIEYFVAGDEVLAFVITARAYHVHRYLCPMSRVDYLTERYYGAFRNHAQKQRGSSSRDATLQASADQFLHQLYVTLVAPLEDDIEGVKLLLVPHGLMHYLPFHAFYDGNSYLTDRFDIAYAPSSSVLHQCNVQKSAPSLLRVPGVLEPQSAFAFNSARSEEGIRVRIAATGEEPKEEFLQSISAADRIHISSDCLLRYDSPLFSGFKLRGGWITALDLFSISCHSDLVTLSGSMSAINRDGRGEDIVAIQRGWLYAGAQTILMRLWNTDDRMTEAILSAFHVRWDGRETTKCSALRRAMRDVREEHPNPYRWAPFIICGRG